METRLKTKVQNLQGACVIHVSYVSGNIHFGFSESFSQLHKIGCNSWTLSLSSKKKRDEFTDDSSFVTVRQARSDE